MTWLLFYIAYSLWITDACQEGPKCGQVVTHSSVTSPRHRETDALALCVCACACVPSMSVRTGRTAFSYTQPRDSRNPAQQLFLQIFFFVCPQGSFSQSNCLRGLFPRGILFQNVPVKISFWGGRKKKKDFFFNLLKYTNPQSHKNSPNCVSWN